MTAFQCRDMAIAAAEPGREHENQLQNRWRTGRPRSYDSPQQMQEAIDTYFEQEESPTICGLALALGFNSRQSLLNYEGYSEEFLDTTKRAKLRVEASYEQGLRGPHAAGRIFALKNFGWKDRQEHVVRTEPEGPKTIEQVAERIKALQEAGDALVSD